MLFWDRFANWLEQPFSEDMDAMGWFLFAGLLLIISVAWATIIRKVAS